MSLGSRSGVNCTRRTEASRHRARVLASRVLPTPGTSSRSRCPSASSTVIAVRTTGCLPSMTEFIAAASWLETCSTWSREAPRVLGSVVVRGSCSLTRVPSSVRLPAQRPGWAGSALDLATPDAGREGFAPLDSPAVAPSPSGGRRASAPPRSTACPTAHHRVPHRAPPGASWSRGATARPPSATVAGCSAILPPLRSTALTCTDWTKFVGISPERGSMWCTGWSKVGNNGGRGSRRTGRGGVAWTSSSVPTRPGSTRRAGSSSRPGSAAPWPTGSS